jgi:hypothetical protein
VCEEVKVLTRTLEPWREEGRKEGRIVSAWLNVKENGSKEL